MKKKKFFITNIKEKLKYIFTTVPEIKAPLYIFIFIFCCLLLFDLIPWNKNSFLGQILIEAHGLAFDLFIFGILILVYNKVIVERILEIRKYQEDIYGLKERTDDEARLLILNRIKKLNKLGYTKIDLSSVNLLGAKLSSLNLHNANLQFANLKGANFEGVQLSNADLSYANLEEAYLEGAHLRRAKLVFANLHNCYNRGEDETWLNSADLSNANIQNARLRGIFFDDAVLEMANFNNSYLKFCSFRRTKAKLARFISAKLVGVDFKGANLFMANFKNSSIESYYEELSHGGPIDIKANFEEANLERANLSGVEFKNVNFSGANLKEADLTDSKGLTVEQVCKAKTLYKVKLPPEIEDEIKAKFPHLLKNPENETKSSKNIRKKYN